MPPVEGTPYGTAHYLLRSYGLIEKPATSQMEEISQDVTVIMQSEEAFSYAPKGSEIILYLSQSKGYEPDLNENFPLERNTSSNGEVQLKTEILAYDFDDSFYYEFPISEETGSFWIIDLKGGISGTFTYSRELSEFELKNWSHGGKLYDSFGNEVNATFWSNPEGRFAVEFPEDMPTGTYT